MTKIAPCTLGSQHKWAWQRDRTVTTSAGPYGNRLHISRKGVYRCACGAAKYGQPRSGL